MNDERVVALSARRAARLADLFARDRALPAALDDAGGRLREANEPASPFGRGIVDDLARP